MLLRTVLSSRCCPPPFFLLVVATQEWGRAPLASSGIDSWKSPEQGLLQGMAGAGGCGRGTHTALELLGKTRRGFCRLLEEGVSSLARASGWEEEEAGDYAMRAEQPQ